MIRKKIQALLILIFFIGFSVNAQYTVHGKVTLFDVIAVENAEVTIKKSKLSVQTDSLGYFSIECQVKDKILISADGFDKKTIKVKNLKDSIRIDLKIAGKESDIELAATKGHINRNEVSFAIIQFNTKPAYSLGFTSTLALVLGKYPQISLVNNEFILRGINTVDPGGSNGALIVINDIISNIETLKSIVVTEVKDIKILTGYAANKYGPGAGNGVIWVILNSY